MPYTVHFELDSTETPALADDKSLSDIFEPIVRNNNKEPENSRTRHNRGSVNQYDESNLSIIESLSQNNNSSTNLSVVESLDSEDQEHNVNFNSILSESHINTDDHLIGSDIDSISSITSLVDSATNSNTTSKSKLNSLASTISGPSIHNGSQHTILNPLIHPSAHQATHHPPHSQNFLHKTSSHRSSTSSVNNVSIHDFFFNNPNKAKMDLCSTSLDDVTSASTSAQHAHEKSSSKVSNLAGNNVYGQANSSTKFLKPRPQIKSATPQPTVNELQQKKKKIEPKLSGMKINRIQHSNLRNLKTSSILSLDKKIDGLSLNSSVNSLPANISNDIPLDSFNYDSISNNYTDLLQNEENNVLNLQNDCSSIAPFGGFSRPHNFLDDKNEIFSNAKWKVTDFDKGNGSLINSIEQASKNNVDSFRWVGTVSMPSNIVPDTVKNDIHVELDKNYNSNVIFLDDEIFEGHYQSFCKQILWPIFHYQIPDNPKSNAFENHSWKYYEKVNQIFAEKIAEQYKENDTVWIHDYHLMLVPQMLRKLIPNAKIGFFLHISFPSSEVFRCLAQRKTILEGMLGADCITFQNEEYMAHFLQSSNRLLLADFNDVGVFYNNKMTVVSYNPIGLDAQHLKAQLKSNVVKNWKNLVNARWGTKKLIISRDKMDKIRGLKEKLLAYERFLEQHPEFLSSTILILICVENNTTDEDYKNEIFSIVERINSRTENISIDQPVIFLNTDIEFEQYLALLSEAHIFIVSTLREGMNLTCHEFICASEELHSPLILSEFVGSASVLTDGPLLSNPYNIKQVSNQIYNCLNMSESEKDERWNKTYQLVLKNDSKSWVNKCLNDINLAYENVNFSQISTSSKPLNMDIYEHVFKYEKFESVTNNSKKLYILNLDNLTANLEIHGKTIHSAQQQLINKTLSNLLSDSNNHVYIFSLFQRTELLRLYSRVPDIGLIAESGALIKPPFSSDWFSVVEEKYEKEWIPTVVDIINSFCERIPGSYIDVEECGVVFHTECAINFDKDYINGLVGDLITHINELFGKDYNVHASLSKGILIIKEMNLISKALDFVSEQYMDDPNVIKLPNTGSTYASPVFQANSPNSLPITPIKLSLSNSSMLSALLEANKTFKQFFICGGTTRVDQEIYSFFNNITEKVNIDDSNIVTVCVGETEKSRTCAKYSLKGINNLITLLN